MKKEGVYRAIHLSFGNNEFQRIINSKHVDKTGLLSLNNNAVGNLVCVSIPRRFLEYIVAESLMTYINIVDKGKR